MPSSLDLAGRLSAVVALQQEILRVASDVDKVTERIVTQIPTLTNATGAVIEMIDGDDLVYRAASGPASAHIGKRLTRAGSLSGEAIAKRTVMRSDDTDADARVDRVACRIVGIRSMIIAPLMTGSEAFGALKTYSGRANAFDDLDTYTVQLLAGMASGALQLAHEFRSRQLSEERYRMLFERNVAGVFRTTDDGQILDCNDAMAETLGYASREELLGRQTWDLYLARSDREAFLENVRSRQAMKNVRMQLKRKDGTPLSGLVSVCMIPTGGKDFQLLGTLVEE